MRNKIVSLAASLLTVAGLGPRRVTDRVTVTAQPACKEPKPAYRNSPPIPSTTNPPSRIPAAFNPTNLMRFNQDQGKRRRRMRQVHSRGFKHRHNA